MAYLLLLVLLVLVLASAIAKVASGHSPAFSLSPSVFYGAAALELMIAVGLTISTTRVPAALVAAGFFSAATLYSVLESAPCGCLGTLVETNRQARTVIAAVGAASAFGWLASRTPSPPRDSVSTGKPGAQTLERSISAPAEKWPSAG